jgi:hypothetical protein
MNLGSKSGQGSSRTRFRASAAVSALLALSSCGSGHDTAVADDGSVDGASKHISARSAPTAPPLPVSCKKGEALGAESALLPPVGFDRAGTDTPEDAVQQRVERAAESRDRFTKRLADPELRYADEATPTRNHRHRTFVGRTPDGTPAVAISVQRGGSLGRWLVGGLVVCQKPSTVPPKPKSEDRIVYEPSCDLGDAVHIRPGDTDHCDKEDHSE